MLLETRQTHMFEHWAEPGVEDDEKKPSLIRGSTKTLGNFVKFLLLGVVPFPKDVPRLKQLGVGGVITLNEPCETLVPTSFYLAHEIDHLVIPTRDYLFAPSFELIIFVSFSTAATTAFSSSTATTITCPMFSTSSISSTTSFTTTTSISSSSTTISLPHVHHHILHHVP
ncbi:hypothetical protein ACJW31_07G095500 [Castanea mollissima]